MKSRTKTKLTCLMVALVASAASGAKPTEAASERMQLLCESGSLQGRTLERTNGSSWWDIEAGTVYTTKSLTISDHQDVVHAHDYGKKSRAAETCASDHFDWRWDLEVVQARR